VCDAYLDKCSSLESVAVSDRIGYIQYTVLVMSVDYRNIQSGPSEGHVFRGWRVWQDGKVGGRSVEE
jgi:hypothetical protein